MIYSKTSEFTTVGIYERQRRRKTEREVRKSSFKT